MIFTECNLKNWIQNLKILNMRYRIYNLLLKIARQKTHQIIKSIFHICKGKKNCLAYIIKNVCMIFPPLVVTGITYWFNTLIQMRNKWKHKNLYLNYEKQKKWFSEVDTNADNFGLNFLHLYYNARVYIIYYSHCVTFV